MVSRAMGLPSRVELRPNTASETPPTTEDTALSPTIPPTKPRAVEAAPERKLPVPVTALFTRLRPAERRADVTRDPDLELAAVMAMLCSFRAQGRGEGAPAGGREAEIGPATRCPPRRTGRARRAEETRRGWSVVRRLGQRTLTRPALTAA